jgi:antitoxin FitA
MVSITIEPEEQQEERFRAEARKRNASVEELVRAGALALLDERDTTFEAALDYVLQKNRELYQRL